jgi:L-fuconolactonase
LNAFGGPLGIGPYKGLRQEVFEQWRLAMRALSHHENVYVHISGFGAKMLGFGFHNHESLPSNEQFAAAWRPYLEHCLDTFGPARCMVASNFPEDRSSISYRQIWNVYKHLSSDLSAYERHMLFSGTTAKVYNLQ